MRFNVKNKNIIHVIVASLCSAFLKRIDFYKGHRSEKRGVIWLASYPMRCDWPNTLPCTDRRDETIIIKPIINEAFVASSEDIITDYNDSYLLFTCRVAKRKENLKSHHMTLWLWIVYIFFFFFNLPLKLYILFIYRFFFFIYNFFKWMFNVLMENGSLFMLSCHT